MGGAHPPRRELDDEQAAIAAPLDVSQHLPQQKLVYESDAAHALRSRLAEAVALQVELDRRILPDEQMLHHRDEFTVRCHGIIRSRNPLGDAQERVRVGQSSLAGVRRRRFLVVVDRSGCRLDAAAGHCDHLAGERLRATDRRVLQGLKADRRRLLAPAAVLTASAALAPVVVLVVASPQRRVAALDIPPVRVVRHFAD
ncbi:membrane-associated zinc metalloprotease, putative [Babesia ovata]|uniref:Membrane-associated zinc metalloprotease, putative n=1 Tax=Babesia ovata TaxID=189622 RepID=A0A2H6KA13_9APIC|nr:membrane-associated zinc metalloprotease, putative [Babesia ovata]GBE59837.1 membrane-associated zinc metalloprotease, putative [Babesia ovata]